MSDSESFAEYSITGDACVEGVAGLPEYQVAGQHYPTHADGDPQQGGDHEDATRDVAVDAGLLPIDQEQEGQAERCDGDQSAWQSQCHGEGHREQHQDETEIERRSGKLRQVREQRTGDRRT